MAEDMIEIERLHFAELSQFVYQVEQKFLAKFNGAGDVSDDDLFWIYNRAQQLREKYEISISRDEPQEG